jgi:CheY-like chemotaxis protein
MQALLRCLRHQYARAQAIGSREGEVAFEIRHSRRDRSAWTKVSDEPERWERPGFGAIIAKSARLWAFLPICGHDYYPASSLDDAQATAEARSGLCFVCRQLGVTGATSSVTDTTPWTAREVARDAVRLPERQAGLVLLVEDDLDTRETVGELLEDHGYSVLGAGNGVEAVHLLQSGILPSVILLDLMMPVMDGYRFRAQQRSNPALASIPVIVITAGQSIAVDELDVSAVMRKPLHVPRLLATIDQHCSC